MHYPVTDEFDEDYFKHLTNERKTKKVVRGKRVVVWDAGNRRNEPFDTSVYNLAAIRILQQHFGIVLHRYTNDEVDEVEGEGEMTPTRPPTPPPAARPQTHNYLGLQGDWL
jgi:phage terminase large subunit GpA-like protein